MITATKLYDIKNQLTPEIEQGIRLHRIISNGNFSFGGYEGEECPRSREEEIMLYRCESFFDSLIDKIKEPIVCEFEKKLPVKNLYGEVEIYGKADVFIHSTMSHNVCILIDWKFGKKRKESPDEDLQMMSYALGAMQYSGADKAVIYVFYPSAEYGHNDDIARCCVTYSKALETVKSVYPIVLPGPEFSYKKRISSRRYLEARKKKFRFKLWEHQYRSWGNTAVKTSDPINNDNVFETNGGVLVEHFGDDIYDKIEYIELHSREEDAYPDLMLINCDIFLGLNDGSRIYLKDRAFVCGWRMEDYRLKDLLTNESVRKYISATGDKIPPEYWSDDEGFEKDLT